MEDDTVQEHDDVLGCLREENAIGRVCSRRWMEAHVAEFGLAKFLSRAARVLLRHHDSGGGAGAHVGRRRHVMGTSLLVKELRT